MFSGTSHVCCLMILMVSDVDVLPVDMSVVQSYHSKLLVIGVVLSYKWWVLLL